MTRKRYLENYRHKLIPEFQAYWDYKKFVGLEGFFHVLVIVFKVVGIPTAIILFYTLMYILGNPQ